jgi:hypothetical protein
VRGADIRRPRRWEPRPPAPPARGGEETWRLPHRASGAVKFDGCERHLFRLTSIALRKPLLIRLKHMEVMKIIAPCSAAT